MTPAKNPSLQIIGSTEYVEIASVKNIPAKIDTGADSSAIWASNINMEQDGTLCFCLFDQESPFYTGEIIKTTDYTVKSVRSSHGDKQIRYCVKLPIIIAGRVLETKFTLADRSRNHFPILIGRHTLEGNFLVDVAISSVDHHSPKTTPCLNQELQADPYAFHQKYLRKGAL